MHNRNRLKRLLSLWLALCLLVLPVLTPAATGMLAPADGATLQAGAGIPCDACDEALMDDQVACASGCVHAACVMAHCALFVPLARAAPLAMSQGLRPAAPPAAFYRSHLPGLLMRPPIS